MIDSNYKINDEDEKVKNNNDKNNNINENENHSSSDTGRIKLDSNINKETKNRKYCCSYY